MSILEQQQPSEQPDAEKIIPDAEIIIYDYGDHPPHPSMQYAIEPWHNNQPFGFTEYAPSDVMADETVSSMLSRMKRKGVKMVRLVRRRRGNNHALQSCETLLDHLQEHNGY